ncbi:unnamed protein product [Mytilus coruscus]|uniref:DEAD/DEAH-box helicase domain-containing protein n=1 Tax=Mytilus coruscus TaxID=42192 RepID=A0A6J8CRX2_MYTCO|nr:unnamed protein product [Mytilus coruscus]
MNSEMSFKYYNLKDKQEQAINLCKSRDVLVVLPTGYGKTVIIQALPYIEEDSKCCLVINGLNAIIEEQEKIFGDRCVHITDEVVKLLEKEDKTFTESGSAILSKEAAYYHELLDSIFSGKVKRLPAPVNSASGSSKSSPNLHSISSKSNLCDQSHNNINNTNSTQTILTHNISEDNVYYESNYTDELVENTSFIQEATLACDTLEEDILDGKKQCAVNVILDLGQDLNDSLEKGEKLEIENNVLSLTLKKRCTAKYKLKLKRTELCSLKKTVCNLNNRITSQRTVLKRIRSQKVNDKSIAKLDDLKIQNNELIAHMASLQNELSSLREKFKDEREENEYLRLLISDDIGKSIKLYDEQSRKYTKEAQECVYQLLNNNVTTSRVGPVITTVLKLVGMRPNKLPSVSTVNNINVHRLILAQTYDETSKYGTQFEGYHVSDNEGRLWVLGLRNILTKGAKDTLKTFQEILQDINEVSEVCDHEAGKKVLLNIVSTMSDRASTQIKFNELLEEYRAEMLQDQLGESWGQMSDNEKLSSNDSNRLLKSVKFDVNKNVFVAGCKALGLIAYLITVPLWQVIEDKTIHILDISVYYKEIIEYIESSIDDIESFMSGKTLLSFCNMESLAKDRIFTSLIDPSDYDDTVSVILRVILPGICNLLKQLFSDYLTGGKWEFERNNQELREIKCSKT